MSLLVHAEVRRGDFTLRVDADLHARATGIFGASGAGKSTLLALIAGLVRPTAGRVELAGQVFDDVAAGIHVPTHQRRLGVVFQHGLLLPHRSVLGNLRYGEALVPLSERRFTVPAVVELLELVELLERRPRDLSGGQRQRVALGRALLCSPRLLLLDEPLAALDRGLKQQIQPYLRRVRERLDLPIIHVSHDLSELALVTDELLLIDQGTAVAQGPLSELAMRADVLPRLHDLGLANVIPARVESHHPDDGLTRLALTPDRSITCGLIAAPVGSQVDVLLRPTDIAVAGMAIPDISLQNQLPGRITAITHANNRTVLAVDVGVPLLVEVSAKAVRDHGFTVHAQVWCLFKAQAVVARG